MSFSNYLLYGMYIIVLFSSILIFSLINHTVGVSPTTVWITGTIAFLAAIIAAVNRPFKSNSLLFVYALCLLLPIYGFLGEAIYTYHEAGTLMTESRLAMPAFFSMCVTGLVLVSLAVASDHSTTKKSTA